ncbi:MAG: transcriptional repressor, partial [Proteobacteria bacterium]
TEFSDHAIGHKLDDWLRSSGFAPKKAVIEFRGTCAKCLARAA